MDHNNNTPKIHTEPVSLSKGDKEELFDMVDAAQRDRITRNLTPELAPKILLPYQARWHADKSVVRLGNKSRRIGASWGWYAAEGALEASAKNGMSQYYMGYNLGMAAENIGDAVKFSEVYGLIASEISVHRDLEVRGDEQQTITRYKITYPTGWVYEALSSAPWGWRGRQGHARIDEAAYHKDLQEVVKGALAFRLWGGRIDIISSQNGQDNQFNLYVLDIVAGKLNWSYHHVDFDDALREGFYKRVCLVTGQEWSPEAEAEYRQAAFDDYPDQADANEELLTIPKMGSGTYIPRSLYEQVKDKTVPVIRLKKPDEYVLDDKRLAETETWLKDVVKPIIDSMPAGQRTVLGQDFGRSGDLSTMDVLREESAGYWPTAFVVELRNIPFDVQEAILFFILDNLPLFFHAKFDARGNGSSHAEAALQKYGPARIDCVMFTPAWYATHFPKYKAALEDRSTTKPDSEDMIADHRRVILDKGRPKIDDGRDKGSDGGYRHGDTAVSGVLSWAATLEEGQPPAGESIESDTSVFEPEAARGRRRVSMYRRVS